MTKIKVAIEMLSNLYDPEEDICISWWDKHYFNNLFIDTKLSPLTDEEWEDAVDEFNYQEGFGHCNEQVADRIFQSIVNKRKSSNERTQLEQEIVDSSKYIWGDNSTEYLVGLLSSISTTEQLEVLVNNLKNKIKQGDIK